MLGCHSERSEESPQKCSSEALASLTSILEGRGLRLWVRDPSLLVRVTEVYQEICFDTTHFGQTRTDGVESGGKISW